MTTSSEQFEKNAGDLAGSADNPENEPAYSSDIRSAPARWVAGENFTIDPCPSCKLPVESVVAGERNSVAWPCGHNVWPSVTATSCALRLPGASADERVMADMGELVAPDPDEPMELHEPCELPHVHGRHQVGTPAEQWTCPGRDVAVDASDGLGSYADMFAEYLTAQRHWIGPAQQPLVFHIRKLCLKLDGDDDAPASFSSAYLQAIQRLDRQRPGSKVPAGSDGDLPGQGSIFDELPD